MSMLSDVRYITVYRHRQPGARRARVTLTLVGLVALGMLIQSMLGVEGNQQLANSYGVTAGSWDWLAPHSYLTLVTFPFLHGNALHYLSNAIMLLLVGVVVESRLRGWVLLALWLTGSALSALAHVVLFPDLNLPLIGASGGIAVLLGVALVVCRDVHLPLRLGRVSCAIPLWGVLLAWAALQLYQFVQHGLLSNGPPAVAYWSHLAGFVFGALALAALHIGAPALARRAPLPQSISIGD